MTFYTDLRDGVAKDLLTRFNQGTKEIEVTPKPVPSTLADDPTPGSPVLHKFNGTVKGFKTVLISGEQIRVGDLEVIVQASGLTITPRENDICILDATRYPIINVKPNPAAGDAITYTLHVGAR